MLGWLRNKEILPGKKIQLISKDKFGDSVIIKLSNVKERLSFSVASQVQVSFGANI